MPINKAKVRKVRVDPKPRPLMGSAPWNELENPRPDKSYVIANKGDPMFGESYYRALGYEAVVAEPGGTRFKAGVTCQEGEAVELMGNVLMMIDKNKKEEIDQYGVSGTGGQMWADQIEKKIIQNRYGMDEMRGINTRLGQYGRIESGDKNEQDLVYQDLVEDTEEAAVEY